MKRKLFVHLHIPKCGGSSVGGLLEKNFGLGLKSTNGILNDYQYDREQVSRIIDHFPAMKCLTGHKLSLDLPYDRDDLDITAFTVIRDPVDRFLSHYFYHRNHTHRVAESKEQPLEAYTDWPLREGNQPMYVNGQTRFLSGGHLRAIEAAVNEGRLLLFPLERIQDAFFTLADRYPDSFKFWRMPVKNVSKKDQKIPDSVREKILSYVQMDLRLLEMARRTPLTPAPPRSGLKTGTLTDFMRNPLVSVGQFLQKAGRFCERSGYRRQARRGRA